MAAFKGTDLPETITGSAGDDAIQALGGNDTVNAGAGNDVISGGAGNDHVFGEAGADTIEGGTGADLLDGGDGDDDIRSGDGNDTVYGGQGNDKIVFASSHTENSHTIAFGGDGDDVFITDGIQRTGSSYEATGGEGRDLYQIGRTAASVTINDFSAAGGDVLDLLVVTAEDVAVNPFASGYLKAEEVAGSTVISLDYDGPNASQYQWQTLVTLKGVTLAQLPTYAITGGFDVTGSVTGKTIEGGVADDELIGEYLNDTISGGAGNDRIDGSGGNDLVTGGDEEVGGDRLMGGNGDDTMWGGGGDDWLEGGRHNDQLHGGAGLDGLDGGLGDDVLYGDDGNDHLYDSWGSNQMYGGAGDDYLDSGNDLATLVDGGEGNDRLIVNGLDTAYGGAGNDEFMFSGGRIDQVGQQVIVDAGEGDDQLNHFGTHDAYKIIARGGPGSDTYRFGGTGTAGHAIEILDFATGAGGDVFDFHSLGYVGWGNSSINPFGSAGFMRVLQEGADTLLQYDADGSAGNASSWHTIAILRDVQLGSLDAHNMAQGGMNFDGSFANIHATGTGQADVMTGSPWADSLDGQAGNDRLTGGTGDDLLSGGDGTDFGIFSGERTQYRLGGDGTAMHVVLERERYVETDRLVGVERIVFDDRTVALDMDGVAGQVYRLYQAAFNRTPDLAGVGFWIGIADGGMPLTQIASSFMTSPEFASLYGAAPTNEALVRLFYVNALHRQPDDAGVDFWTGVLDSGSATVEEVLAGFSESAENVGAVAAVIGDWFEYIPYA